MRWPALLVNLKNYLENRINSLNFCNGDHDHHIPNQKTASLSDESRTEPCDRIAIKALHNVSNLGFHFMSF